jgi:iduronate 2-sulfatase
MKTSRLFMSVLMLTALYAAESRSQAAEKPNVLFIAIDDLRGYLGEMGVPQVKTPNLDALAENGRLFNRHYTQVPTCGASRCSLMRGCYPEVPGQLSNGAIALTHDQWAEKSMPGWFHRNGYQTLALGKITHHPGGLTGKDWAEGPEELPGVWDRSWIPDTPWGTPKNIMHGYANGVPRTPGVSPPFENFDGPDTAYPDAWIADEAIKTLGELAETDQPWFFAVGFFKPHLPFASPKKWFDRYESATLPDIQPKEKPEGVTSWHASGEFRNNYGHDGKDPQDDPEYARTVHRAYVSAVSYMDAQVGRLLDSLDKMPVKKNTIVVVWSDHGFLLGEHAIWGKHCLYENALRSPLIISMPGMKEPGVSTESIVETVDVFPTLADLCDLPAPPELHGRSLRNILDDPKATLMKPAHGFFGRNQRTIRTDRWRMILLENNSGETRGVELFDYKTDPSETTDVASQNAEIIEQLKAKLNQVPNPHRPEKD